MPDKSFSQNIQGQLNHGKSPPLGRTNALSSLGHLAGLRPLGGDLSMPHQVNSGNDGAVLTTVLAGAQLHAMHYNTWHAAPSPTPSPIWSGTRDGVDAWPGCTVAPSRCASKHTDVLKSLFISS
jgi:hypothetical protein